MTLRRLLGGTALLILLLAALPTFASAADNLKEVFVANGPDDPVPTKPVGTTTVDGAVSVSNLPATQPVTGSVDAAQSGEWTVGVRGTPNVQLAPSQPVTFRCEIDLPAGVNSGGAGCFNVPTGKRLVIETVSAQVVVPTGQYPVVTFRQATVEPELRVNTLAVPLTDSGPMLGGRDVYSGLSQVRVYSDDAPTLGGEEIVAIFERNSSTDPARAFLVFSGYLFDA